MAELRTVETNREFDEAIKNGLHGMSIIGKSGDNKQIWDPDNEAETEAARAVFNSLTAKKYIAFHVKDDGKKAERMPEFDPDAGKMIMVPKPVGG